MEAELAIRRYAPVFECRAIAPSRLSFYLKRQRKPSTQGRIISVLRHELPEWVQVVLRRNTIGRDFYGSARLHFRTARWCVSMLPLPRLPRI
jgi:hypothetical protein